MLQIRLSKQVPELEAPSKPLPDETVTVACPDHLVLADLPVAKGIGAATAATAVKTVGRRSRRHLGERVHFCVRCDFPIAVYGRLSPCEHVFCLDCARSDSICYLCDERILNIQRIRIMEGIFICAAPHCLKSFLKRSEFTSHIQESHADLLHPNVVKDDGNESEVQSARQPDATVRAPPRPPILPGSNPPILDVEEKARRPPPLQRPMMPSKQPHYMQTQGFQPEIHHESNRIPGFDRPGGQSHYQMQLESGQFLDQQQGILSEAPNPDYPPMHPVQPPNFVMPMNPNALVGPQFGLPPLHAEGGQPFHGAPYEMGQMVRPDSASEVGAEQGSLLGFPPGPPVGMNFAGNYPPPWNAGPAQGGQAMGEGFGNTSDSQGNVTFYQGDYGRNMGVLPMVPLPPGPPPSGNKVVEPGNNFLDPRDGRGILAPQPLPHLHPPPLQHPAHSQRSRHFSSDRGHDGHGFGWQHENRDDYASSQD